MKHLTLVRHAKSSWKDPELDDFERPLNERGRRDAPDMAARLVARGALPERIVTSPAVRALATAEVFAQALDIDAERIERIDGLYAAGVDELVRTVRGLDPSWDRVLLVAHNPGLTELARWLVSNAIEELPTCAVVELELAIGRWAEAGRKTGRLVLYDYPKHTG